MFEPLLRLESVGHLKISRQSPKRLPSVRFDTPSDRISRLCARAPRGVPAAELDLRGLPGLSEDRGR